MDAHYLRDKLIPESGAIIKKMLDLYHSAVREHGGKSIWSIASPVVLESRDESRSFSNTFHRYLSHGATRWAEGVRSLVHDSLNEEGVLVSEVKAEYEKEIGKRAGQMYSMSIFGQMTPKFETINFYRCKSCLKKATAQPICCSDYHQDNRKREVRVLRCSLQQISM